MKGSTHFLVEQDGLDEAVEAAEKRLMRRRADRDFIKGPVDWEWLVQASRVCGKKTLLVGLALWRLKGLQGHGALNWELRTQERLGLSRRTVHYALCRLEKAGLVSLERRRGRRALITIVLPDDPTR